MSLADAVIELKVTLGYWKRPTAWDRVIQDEPLNTPKSEFVSTVVTNTTAANPITINTATSFNHTVTPILVDAGVEDHLKLIIRHMRNGVVEDDHLYILNRSSNDTGITQGLHRSATAPWQPDGFHHGLGLNIEPIYRFPAVFPYPRTSKERRVLKILGDRLPETIKKAAKVLGPNDGSAEWNHRFFEFVSRVRVRNEVVARRQAKGFVPRTGSR